MEYQQRDGGNGLTDAIWRDDGYEDGIIDAIWSCDGALSGMGLWVPFGDCWYVDGLIDAI